MALVDHVPHLILSDLLRVWRQSFLEPGGSCPHRVLFDHSLHLLFVDLRRDVALDDLLDGSLFLPVLVDLVHDLLGISSLLRITLDGVLGELPVIFELLNVEVDGFHVGVLCGG